MLSAVGRYEPRRPSGARSSTIVGTRASAPIRPPSPSRTLPTTAAATIAPSATGSDSASPNWSAGRTRNAPATITSSETERFDQSSSPSSDAEHAQALRDGLDAPGRRVVRCHSAPFAGMTRSRFDGCDLSPQAGHPGRGRIAPVLSAMSQGLSPGTRTDPISSGLTPVHGRALGRRRGRAAAFRRRGSARRRAAAAPTCPRSPARRSRRPPLGRSAPDARCGSRSSSRSRSTSGGADDMHLHDRARAAARGSTTLSGVKFPSSDQRDAMREQLVHDGRHQVEDRRRRARATHHAPRPELCRRASPSARPSRRAAARAGRGARAAVVVLPAPGGPVTTTK